MFQKLAKKEKEKKTKTIDVEKLKKQAYERTLRNAKRQQEKNIEKIKERKEEYVTKAVDVEKLKKQAYERTLRNAKRQQEKNIEKIKERKEEYVTKTVDVEKLKKQAYERMLRNAKRQQEKNIEKIKERKEEYVTKTVDVEKLKKQAYERMLRNAKRQQEKNKEKIKHIKVVGSVKENKKPVRLRVNKRAKFSEYNLVERKNVYERDKGVCIYCSSQTYLGIAHIFASRAKGGKGCKENGVLLCQDCHNKLDNGKDPDIRKKIQKYCEEYLLKHYKNIDISNLIYSKK